LGKVGVFDQDFSAVIAILVCTRYEYTAIGALRVFWFGHLLGITILLVEVFSIFQTVR
jgi:hypothetical protein